MLARWGFVTQRSDSNRPEKAQLLTSNSMKKNKTTKSAITGTAEDFAEIIKQFADTGKHPQGSEVESFFAIEEAANKLEKILADKKLSSVKKLNLAKKYVYAIQEAVIDATSFKIKISG